MEITEGLKKTQPIPPNPEDLRNTDVNNEIAPTRALPEGHLNDDAFEHEDGDLKNKDTRELSTKPRFGELEAYKQEIKKATTRSRSKAKS